MAGGLAEADYELTRQAMEASDPLADDAEIDPADETMLIRFFSQPVPDEEASREAGRPMVRDEEFISIRAPGSREEFIAPAEDYYKRRYRKWYEAYKQRTSDEEVVSEGTPLSAWPVLTASQVLNLKGMHIHTVEQLAAVSDQNAQGVMGLLSLRGRAKLFLEAAQGSAFAEKMATELEERDNKIDTLENTVQEMAAELKALREERNDPVSTGDGDPEPNRRRTRTKSGG